MTSKYLHTHAHNLLLYICMRDEYVQYVHAGIYCSRIRQ